MGGDGGPLCETQRRKGLNDEFTVASGPRAGRELEALELGETLCNSSSARKALLPTYSGDHGRPAVGERDAPGEGYDSLIKEELFQIHCIFDGVLWIPRKRRRNGNKVILLD